MARTIRPDATRKTWETHPWVFPRTFGATMRDVRDGIADPAGAPAREADGRHRAYLMTWRDPDGTYRMESPYPGSMVARLESETAVRGARVRNRYGIMGFAAGEMRCFQHDGRYLAARPFRCSQWYAIDDAGHGDACRWTREASDV